MFVFLSLFCISSNVIATIKLRDFIFGHHIIDSPRVFGSIDISTIESSILFKKINNLDFSILKYINIILTVQLFLAVIVMTLWNILLIGIYYKQKEF